MEQIHARLEHAVVAASREAAPARGDTPAAAAAVTAQPASGTGDSPLRGISLSSATATLGAGRTLITDYIMGANNTLAEIRVIDPATHQVVAVSPPETITHIQQEMLAYQSLGK